jgi:L-ornithine Nalpha-acyltransferase
MARINAEFEAKGLDPTHLSVRLATSATEIRAAQALRFDVFFEERGVFGSADVLQSKMDSDHYDDICDHLLVERDDGRLVGTYRLLRQDVATRHHGFYTAQEFEIEPLLARHKGLRFLELGRSCVSKEYRTRPVVELLWQGIWNYVRMHKLDVMFGCASFEGANPSLHAQALSFLYQHASAGEDWHVRARPERFHTMDLGAVVNERAALRLMPPLIKGYLRLGCKIGQGCVIDQQFNTVDVLVVLPVSKIDPRYFKHFGQPDEIVSGAK